MKRIIGILLALLTVFSVFPLSVLASEPDIISGKSASIVNKDADSLSIYGMEFSTAGGIDMTAVITVEGCDNPNACINLNGKKIASLENGQNTVEFNSNDLLAEGNELRIMISTANGPYDDSVVYGSLNGDDITVNSVVIYGMGESKPDSVKLYMPIVGEAGSAVKEAAYSESVAVGDGWSADTNLGGTTPNVPVSVGYIFDKPDTDGVFSIDTTQIPDGTHTAVFSKGGKTVSEVDYIIDNTAPDVIFSVENGAKVSRLDKVKYSVNDTTDVTSVLYVDGVKKDAVDVLSLSLGNHTVRVNATDEAGNTCDEMLVFTVTDKRYAVEFGEKSVTMSVLGDASVYTAKLMTELRMFENRLGDINQDYLRSDDEVLVSFDDKAELVTSSQGNYIPYQSFVVSTEGVREEYMYVSYSGETGNGSDIVLKAWNYSESKWDAIATTPSGVAITIPVELAKYSYKNRMRINAMPDIVYNGSDSIVWNSDTQYYSRFEDLNHLYTKIANYTVEQYNQGNIGYYVHTGDLVDRTNEGAEIAHSEYTFASSAQKILDDAMVPNGVVSGNHDIVHTDADYSYYWKYFGESRYDDFPWYGGSLNNNMHHYDLVSIGAYDFVFMYLGCYKETEADTIAWANAVCEAYPDRNVIICTHEYLLPSGAYSSERSQVIWDEIIVPNENVMMVLCGHNTGVCDQIKQVGDTDRYVLEILADYQFAELGVGPQHVLNGCTCDGEGYVRLMTFSDAGQLISTTYSPAASEYDVYPYNFYPSYSDSFVYDLDLIPANRSIKTTDFNVAYDIEYVGEIGDDDISLVGEQCFFAELKGDDGNVFSEIYVLDEYEIDYNVPKASIPEVPVSEKVVVTGYSNVSGNFRMDEDNEFPTEEFIKVGLDLMPAAKSNLKQTSGSNVLEYDVVDGKVVISHEKGNNATWVTLMNTVNKKVDVTEYDRIYFGVSSDKNTKWNLCVNFATTEINFSQNKNISSLFGYINETPSDIMGTWNGYIDISDFVQGEQVVKSIYLVSATPGESVTFDYLFLGKSEGGKVEFITDDKTMIAYETKIGDTVQLPGDPFVQGYTFDGWYTQKDGGERVTNGVVASADIQRIYARFSEKTVATRTVKTYNTEVTLENVSVWKIIFVIGCLLMMALVVLILMYRIKNSNKVRRK